MNPILLIAAIPAILVWCGLWLYLVQTNRRLEALRAQVESSRVED